MLTNVLSAPNTARGVTAGTSKPSGGGNFVYGMNSLTNVVGVVGLYATPQAPNTNFNPLVKGGDVRGAVIRAASGGLADWSAFLFIGLNGNDVANIAYILGLSDGNPCHIELRKGALVDGLPDAAPSGSAFPNILRQSSEVVVVDTWVHLRLEMVTNDNGDVIVNCYKSTGQPVTAPVWQAIPGMAAFTDDALGINSGSVPLVGGRVGFGAKFADVTRRAFFDHLEVAKQI
jgi:hypothetical protein